MVHKLLNHENIIKYFGRRKEHFKEYIYLEYASRGELFQMIGKICLKSYLNLTYLN